MSTPWPKLCAAMRHRCGRSESRSEAWHLPRRGKVGRLHKGRTDMTLSRLGIGLTLVNSVVVAVLVLQGGRTRAADAAAPVLRTQAIELVDGRGTLRASLKIEGEGVLLRMMD